jgi:hypothetical protein
MSTTKALAPCGPYRAFFCVLYADAILLFMCLCVLFMCIVYVLYYCLCVMLMFMCYTNGYYHTLLVGCCFCCVVYVCHCFDDNMLTCV